MMRIKSISKLYRKLLNNAVVLLDPELRTIKNIMKSSITIGNDANSIKSDNESIFLERLADHPQALKISFWENHFEWKTLKQYPEIKGNILDFGCGSGHSDIFLARNGFCVCGIDLSRSGIAIANYLKKREDPDVQKRLVFSVADVASDMPPTKLYDSAWASHVFEHLASPGNILKGLSRWLKPKAYILISVPLGRAYDNPGHVNHYYNASQLEKYLNQHVDIDRIDTSEEHKVLRALCRFR